MADLARNGLGSLHVISVIPIVTFVTSVSQRIGKKKTFLLSQSVSIIGYLLFWFCFRPDDPWIILIPLPFFAYGIGGLFTLMTSIGWSSSGRPSRVAPAE